MENGGSTGGVGKKLNRQRSRLQMQAPSSIEVVPLPSAAGDVAEWKVAIPLLSPLDIVSLPSPSLLVETPKDEDEEREKQERRALKWSTWQHPAAPFSFEPAAGNPPAFLLPDCV